MLHWLALALGAGSAVEREPFGALPDGTVVERYTLRSGPMAARILTWGGIVQELWAPDAGGRSADVVLGFDTLEPYLQRHPYFGAICGRVANRVANARFRLDGRTYELAPNSPPHALHGGRNGFDRAVWAAESGDGDAPTLTLRRRSPAGEEGYPGNLDVTVVYTLAADALSIDYTAVTDAPTPVNLTNHSYFNLAGAADPGAPETVLDHVVTLRADHYTPVDEDLIPTGEIDPVDGGPLDFRGPHAIGARIDEVGGVPRGYDHNYVLSGGIEPVLAARVEEPLTGRVMEMATTEPGVQFYTGNFLDGSLTGKGGRAYPQHAGFCLEAQHFPDSPNQPTFPSVVLRPGETYRQTTVYRFAVA